MLGNVDPSADVDFLEVFSPLEISPSAEQNAELYRDTAQLAELMGEFLALVERSALSPERKNYFQVAVLGGYFDDALVAEMTREMDRANEGLVQNIAQLKDAVESGKSDLEDLARQYAESAEAVRHLKEALRQALLIRVERKIEGVGKEQEASTIAAITSQLKDHGKK